MNKKTIERHYLCNDTSLVLIVRFEPTRQILFGYPLVNEHPPSMIGFMTNTLWYSRSQTIKLELPCGYASCALELPCR